MARQMYSRFGAKVGGKASKAQKASARAGSKGGKSGNLRGTRKLENRLAGINASEG